MNQFYAIGFYRNGALKCDVVNCVKWNSYQPAEDYRKMYVGDPYVVVHVVGTTIIKAA